MPPLLLASASPRRAELLRAAGIDFEIAVAAVEELEAPGHEPLALALENARRKAEAVAARHPGRWVLGADTVVALGNRLFAKPASLGEAGEFLRALSGRTHAVITGCVLCGPGRARHELHDLTRVTFRELSEKIIADYLAAVPVLDKAGGYALQEKGEWIVAAVEGSRVNVIGLPVERVLPRLRELGLVRESA